MVKKSSPDCGENKVSINNVALSGNDFSGKWPVNHGFSVKCENENSGWRIITTDAKGINHEYESGSNEYSAPTLSNIIAMHLETYDVSGVEKIEKESEAKVQVNIIGATIYLEANQVMKHVVVTDIAGRKIMDDNPLECSMEINPGEKGIYILEIRLLDGTRIVKKIHN